MARELGRSGESINRVRDMTRENAGWVKVPNSLMREPRLSNAEFRVLLLLMSFGDSCWPSKTYIKDSTGIATIATIDRALRKLRAKNVIVWQRGTKGITNRYYVNPKSVWRLGEVPKARAHDIGNRKLK